MRVRERLSTGLRIFSNAFLRARVIAQCHSGSRERPASGVRHRVSSQLVTSEHFGARRRGDVRDCPRFAALAALAGDTPASKRASSSTGSGSSASRGGSRKSESALRVCRTLAMRAIVPTSLRAHSFTPGTAKSPSAGRGRGSTSSWKASRTASASERAARETFASGRAFLSRTEIVPLRASLALTVPL